MTATAHVPHVQGCCNRSLCWSATAPCRGTPWDRLPECSVAGGTLLGQVVPQVAARTSLSGMGQLAAPPGSPGSSAEPGPPAPVSVQFAESQLTRYAATAGRKARASPGDGGWLCPQAGQGRLGVRFIGQVPLVLMARVAGGLRHPGEGHQHSRQSWQVNVLV